MTDHKTHLPTQNWHLFLDRDGVINRRPVMDYVKNIDEFEFLPGVFEGLKILSNHFKRIFIITNQQGVGKGLMTENELLKIHEWMLQQFDKHGTKIEQIFYCTDLRETPNNCRKPGIAMALQSKKIFPDIEFNQSVMVGDTESDIAFGRNAGMKTVLVGNEQTNLIPDKKHQSLLDFAIHYAEKGGWDEA